MIGLTNFGEQPVRSTRFAELLNRSASEAEALAEQYGWPGTRVQDGLISVNPERAKVGARRQAQIGDRRFGVSGCAPDVLLFAPLVRPTLHLEDTCPTIGTPIRLEFTPHGVERVDPGGTVLAMVNPQVLAEFEGERIGDYDAHICVQMPFFSSAEAAQGWRADHPGGHVFPVREAWDLSLYRNWRNEMSALLNLHN